MPKIGFSSENKQKKALYPTLKFQAADEKARLCVVEPSGDPEAVYMHILRAPQIINGEIKMKTVNSKNGSYETPEMDFIGKHQCFGNFETLVEKGKDPKNCPTCEEAEKYDYIGAAEPRFALHVIRYKTQTGSYKVQEPFQAELLAWTFAGKVFDTLTDIQEEHGDLRARDLLAICTNKMYQNVDLQVGGKAAWTEDDERKRFVKQLFAENKCEDLAPLLARKVSREQAADDVNKVKLRQAQAYGASEGVEASGSAGAASTGAATMNLDSLLEDDDKPAEKPSEPEAAPAEPETSEPEQDDKPAEEKSAAEEPKGETLDFGELDDLLGDL